MSEWQGARGWASVDPGWAALGIGLNGASTGHQAGQTLNNNRVALSTTFTRNGVNRTVGAIDLKANDFFSERYSMDSFLISAIDGFFFLVGKGFASPFRKFGVPFPEFSHWGSVVLGFVVVVCAALLVVFVFSS
jgi:hypothetical protein